jgi:uncharacterized protein (TIGR00251 family)
MDCLSEQKDGTLLLTVYVQPRAARILLTGLHNGALKLSITAPPVEGKANKAVVEYIARLFNIPPKAVSIKSGHQSRTKRLTIKNISLNTAKDLLEEALPSQ